MERFTVRLSFQPGKKLGLMLIDAPCGTSEPGSDPGSTGNGDGAVPTNLGGGGASFRRNGVASGSGDDASSSNGSLRGVSLHRDFAAEAAAATKVGKRKRSTMLCLSPRSPILQLAEQRRAGERDSVPSAVDAAARTSAERGVAGAAGNAKYNEESFEFACTATFQSGDVLERIQHTRKARTVTRRGPPPGRRGSDHRRCRPYFRSDHFDTFHCENKSASEVAGILRKPEHYPLYITFKRPRPVASRDQSLGCDSPPCKRLKTGTSHARNGVCNNNILAKGEVICLLDSSDEDETEMGHGNTSSEEACVKDQEKISLQDTVEMHPRHVPPDPRSMPWLDEEFVLTPFGPGKVLSSRVERYASSDLRSAATIFKVMATLKHAIFHQCQAIYSHSCVHSSKAHHHLHHRSAVRHVSCPRLPGDPCGGLVPRA